MANSKEVDEFVEQKVLPEFHDIVAMLRKLMQDLAPDATEQIYYGLPMWNGRTAPLAWISPTKRDITFGFTFGVEFDDRYGLLKGKGKNARHLKIKKLDGANQEALRYYIQQAVKRDGS
jgi:hypothetical protein